jgi:purine-nucleoside phosphorylase
LSPLRPTAPIASDALLPGDPHRALHLAQDLLQSPKISNLSHGLWGYRGEDSSGRELTIQSLGIGAPSSALVLAELGRLGVRRAVQVGTCRAVAQELELGELLLVGEAIGADGVSRELGEGGALGPDPELGKALAGATREEGVREVTVASVDLIGELDGRAAEWEQRGAAALEMASAALFAAGPRCGVAVASLVVVTDRGEDSISDRDLQQASARMGRLALAALSSSR